MRNIPIVAVGPDDDQERARWLAALGDAIDGNSFCLGTPVERFEERVQELLGVEHAVGLSSGTDALRLALAALGIGRGDEVVVPAFSFFATASAIAHLGALPRFADVDPGTLNLSPEALAARIGPRTQAVVVAHLFGQTADLEALLAICEHHGVPLIEDAAQAFAVRYRAAAAGGYGRAGTFSFYPTKNLAAAGDAGMLITRDAAIAAAVRTLRVHGDAGGYRHERMGWNARMDGFQAAILLVRLERLPRVEEARAANARRYLELIEERGLAERVRPLRRTPGSGHSWHQFVVRVADRDRVRAQLHERGIETGVHYPATLPSQPAFFELCDAGDSFPSAQRAAEEVLALPVHHRLRAGDPERVVAALAELVR